MSDQEDDERNLSGDQLPLISDGNMFLSPDQAHVSFEAENNIGTPIRVLSSNSLAGEDFVLSNRQSFEFPTDDIVLSPFTPSEGTLTPPLSLPDPFTPPPMNPSASSSISRMITQPPANIVPNGSLSGRKRPPRVPQVSLQPSRGTSSRHGRGFSNSELTYLSALTDGTNDNLSHVSSVKLSSNISVPRRRTASWDFHETVSRAQRSTDSPGSLANISTQSTPVNLLQPILSEDFGAPPWSIVTSTRLSRPLRGENSMPQSWKRKEEDTVVAPSNTASSSSSSTQQPNAKAGERFPTTKAAMVEYPSPKANSKRGPVWNPLSQQETGSFVAMSDQSGEDSQSRTPPNGKHGANVYTGKTDPVAMEPKRYTVDEVMEAYPKETIEDALLMIKIESGLVLDPNCIAPDVSPEILAIPVAAPTSPALEEKYPTTLGVSTKKRKKTNDTFGELAKKLYASHCLTSEGSRKGRKSSTLLGSMNAGDEMHQAAENIFAHGAADKDEELAEDYPMSSRERNRANIKRARRPFYSFPQEARNDLLHFGDFLAPCWRSIHQDFTRILRWIMLPCLGVAALLFYVFENPPTGFCEDEEIDGEGDITASNAVRILGSTNTASVSWWLIFAGVRQCITLELARLSQLVIIDFFTLRRRVMPKLLGQSLALVIARSRGWPFIFLLWALLDFALLYGDRKFVHHWAYWQDLVGLMNSRNPSGDITSHEHYLKVLLGVVVVSLAVAVKRSVLGYLFGKRVVQIYREDLGLLMRKLILMSEISHFSVRTAYRNGQMNINARKNESTFQDLGLALDVSVLSSVQQMDSFDYSDAQSAGSKENRRLAASEKLVIMELLGEWEEPEWQTTEEEVVGMEAILQFRRALELVSGDYPFSPSFGTSRTRKECVTSAQILFERLLGDTPEPFLSFETLCLIARGRNCEMDRDTVKEIIRVFRPNRNGQLSKLDFVKSVDSVYKSLRLLLASIQNARQIDRACGSIINVGFYAVLSLVAIAIVGVDMQAMIIGLGSIVVGLAFMIGPASSRAVEGILFVLLRKPYDIGDRVIVDGPASPSHSFVGNSNWIIEKVDLYTTTARLGTTRELATFSNGSLANLRIVNLNRSDKPNVFLNLKFSVDSTLEQRNLFKSRITAFIKERPRQWSKVVDFRRTRVETDLSSLEYTLILQHRERWQNVGAILASREEVLNHAAELEKVLKMKHTSPLVPFDTQHSTSNVTFLDETKKEK